MRPRLLSLLLLFPAIPLLADEPIDIGTRRELFVEDGLIDSLSGEAELRLHHPIPREVAIVHDAPWEGSGSGYHTVFQDGDLYRMYYRGLHMEVQEGSMTAVAESLRPGGTFATFAYVHAVYLPKARRFRRRLESLFTTVEISPVVWLNLPPAFVYRCTK